MKHLESWAQFYRPSKLSECILTEELENVFSSYLKEETFPHLILAGKPGLGKTSVAISFCKEMGCDWIKINSSLEKGIDVVRDKIKEFASSCSFSSDKRKIIILDEADGMLNNAQDALKAFFEEYEMNCGFILTCNKETKLNEALHSRCKVIEFVLTKKDLPYLAKKFYERLEFILKEEEITYDKRTVAMIIKKFYPDWRSILVELQHYATVNSGVIDTGILANKREETLSELIELLKKKNWEEMRKWVGENYNDQFSIFSKKLKKGLEPLLEVPSWPALTVLINEYDFKSHFTVDQEINVTAFLTNCMNELVFVK